MLRTQCPGHNSLSQRGTFDALCDGFILGFKPLTGRSKSKIKNNLKVDVIVTRINIGLLLLHCFYSSD